MENKNIAILGILFFVTSIMTGVISSTYYNDSESKELVIELQTVNEELILRNNEIEGILKETVLDSFAKFESEDDDFVIYKKSDLIDLVKKMAKVNSDMIYYQNTLNKTIEEYKNKKDYSGSGIIIIPSVGGIS